MKEPLKRYFNFSDGQTHDASVTETSDALASCQNYKWSVTPNAQGITGASPDYTIEVSNDGGVTWFEYNSLSTGVSVVDSVEDDHLAFTQMRIQHNSGGSTGGNVEYTLTQKRN